MTKTEAAQVLARAIKRHGGTASTVSASLSELSWMSGPNSLFMQALKIEPSISTIRRYL